VLPTVIRELFEPPAVQLDRQLTVEIERSFCAAGGKSRDLIHDRYRNGCPYCSTLAELVAGDLWNLDGIRGVGDEVAAKLAAYRAVEGI
jgi:hypothetical protein